MDGTNQTVSQLSIVPPLLRLPPEMTLAIAANLSNLDIKQFRLSCKQISILVHPSFERVYFSADKRNLEVLQAIADHPIYSRQVKVLLYHEHVWNNYGRPDGLPISKWVSDAHNNHFVWFRRHGEDTELSESHDGKSALQLRHFQSDKSDKAANQYSETDSSFKLYQQFYDEQQQIKKTGGEIYTLRHSLSAFTSLRCVDIEEITSSPVPQSPLERSLPKDFIWPYGWGPEQEWPGFWLIMTEIFQAKIPIQQLSAILSDKQLVFADSLLKETMGVFRNLRKLKLSLETDGGPMYSLKTILAEANRLQDFRFELWSTMGFRIDEAFPSPSAAWPALRRLELHSLAISVAALIKFLSQLPPTFECLKLKNLQLLSPTPTLNEILIMLRKELKWEKIIGAPSKNRFPGICVCGFVHSKAEYQHPMDMEW